MNRHLTAVPAPGTGLPRAHVPEKFVWELVEFLSFARARVSYSYESRGFTVTFLNTDHAAAQRLLDEWATGSYADASDDSSAHGSPFPRAARGQLSTIS